MIERHITFNVEPNKAAEFERFFAEQYRPPMSKSFGFVGVSLLRNADDGGCYQMVLRWQDGDAATGWRTSPLHQALQPALSGLVSTGAIEVYEVVG